MSIPECHSEGLQRYSHIFTSTSYRRLRSQKRNLDHFLQKGFLGTFADLQSPCLGERHWGTTAAYQATEGWTTIGRSSSGAVKETETESATERECGPKGSILGCRALTDY